MQEHVQTTYTNPPIIASVRKPKQAKKVRDPYDGLRPWSAITHGIGVVLGLIAAALLLPRAWQQGGLPHLTIFTIYILSMIGLYLASTLYHCVNTSISGRLALRKYDHCSIYLLIAGSYTPICLIALQNMTGRILFGAVWVIGLLGIVLTLVKLDIPRWLTSVIYLAMGWLAIFAIVPLSHVLPQAAMTLLLLGGVTYTVGGVLYAVKWPGRNNPHFGCHEIFHLFILSGSFFHFLMMYRIIVFL